MQAKLVEEWLGSLSVVVFGVISTAVVQLEVLSINCMIKCYLHIRAGPALMMFFMADKIDVALRHFSEGKAVGRPSNSDSTKTLKRNDAATTSTALVALLLD